MVEEAEVVEEIERADAFMEDVYDVMAKLEELSQKSSTPATPSAGTVVEPAAKVKLPKLTIQPFKGELTSWTAFWDSYEAAIHTNRSLSDIEKFNYLRPLLQGPAFDAVAGLVLTAANYREAIEILKKRFGNKQRIIDKHMEVLLSLEAVTSDANLKALRRLYDTIETQVRGLRSLGVSSDSYGSLLSSVVLTKVPPETRLVISRKVGDEDRNLDDMMKVLLTELQARERAAAGDIANVKNRERSGKAPPTAAALLARNSGAGPMCYYCQQAHLSHECKNVTSVEEKKRLLREAGRCFACLRKGHVVRQCTSKIRCSHCQGRHHSSICTGKKPESPAPPGAKTPNSTPTITALATRMNPEATPFQPSTSTTLWSSGSTTVLLQTAQTTAFNPIAPRKSCRIRIVFDSGSQWSYVTQHVAKRLSLATEGEQSLTIMTFGSSKEQTHVCNFVNLGLALRDGTMKQFTLFEVPMICEPIAAQPVSFCQNDFSHLAGIELADSSNGRESLTVDLLIGSDYYWDLVTGDVRRGTAGPVAICTKFGWVLSGPVLSHSSDAPATCLATHVLRVDGLSKDSQLLDDRLRSFWDLESFGITDKEQQSVHDDFGTTIQFVNGRYEVQLPWKEAHPTLPDHYQLCVKRLRSLGRRLKQDPATLCEYDATIQSQIQHGIVEPVKPVEDEPELVHYLPHHAVVRQDKATTKVRVVYDASARSTGPSLNDCLHVGPKLNQKILEILLRFRVHRIAVIADIEKAFLMVSMAERDRDVLRFLWFKDACSDQKELMELRFTRVVFGISSSPFLLNATIRHHLSKYESSHPVLVQKLRQSLYVDDVAFGAASEEQAYHMFMTSKRILKEAGFNLRKFHSNSATLQAQVNPEVEPEPAPESDPESSDCSVELESLGSKLYGATWLSLSECELLVASSLSEQSDSERSLLSLLAVLQVLLETSSPLS